MKRPVRKAAAVKGRPTLFKPEYCEQARKICLLGATNQDIAKFFDVSIQTIELWIRKIPAFYKALKEGREYADANVGTRLYERAMGYSHPEEKIFCTSKGRIIRANTIKHYAPDTTACIFWLKNRRSDVWRDQQVVTGPDGGPVNTPPPLVIMFGDKERLVYAKKPGRDDVKLIDAKARERTTSI